MLRTYSEALSFPTFEERYNYLRLSGMVGKDTFGFDRVFNQMFYSSSEWRAIRNFVITRDNGCDLAFPDRAIYKPQKILIHHINPISIEDIKENSDLLLNPEFLIVTSFDTHNAIHYGDSNLIRNRIVERKPNDTCPWRCIT